MVNTRVEQANEDSRTLVFIVNEGPRPGIAEFRFQGNKIFPSYRLAEEARQCLTDFERDYYDAEVFEFCLHRLDNFARSQGYLQARFHDPKVGENDAGLIITSQVDEGILYRLGEITIDGVRDDAARQFRGMLKLNSGDVASGEMVSKWLFEELKAFFGERGYIQYTADVEPEFRVMPNGSGVVDFTVMIDPGRRFKVRKIGFTGDGLQEEQLRQLLLIHDVDIYNQTLFEKSIGQLNDAGMFEPIDKDKDADFRTNEEEGLVDIVINFTKRQN
jgi:outer membrane protein assembly factor BamA